MKWIDEAKHWWRMLSMQMMGLAVLVQGTWSQLPDSVKEHVPAQWVTYGTVAVLVAGMVGRLVKQDLPQDKP